MPIVKVGKNKLLKTLDSNLSYTDEEVEELCSNFGVELDDVTTEKAIMRKEKHLGDDHQDPLSDYDDEIIYKIEVPANRYDLLCLEGLSQGLRTFYGLENEIPTYKLAKVDQGSLLEMHVKPETAQIRPYVVCAILQCRAAALYCSTTSNFDLMHSLLDRIMLGVSVTNESACRLELSREPEFLPGQQTSIIYEGNKIGKLGVVHPEVLHNFDISYPCSILELNLESLL